VDGEQPPWQAGTIHEIQQNEKMIIIIMMMTYMPEGATGTSAKA
jgi:hypothetical protein